MKAGNCPGIVTQSLGATGPGPEQAVYKSRLTTGELGARRGRERAPVQRGQKGLLFLWDGLRAERNDVRRTQPWASCLRRRELAGQQLRHGRALVQSADPSPTLDQHEDPQGSCVHPWLPKLCPNAPSLG